MHFFACLFLILCTPALAQDKEIAARYYYSTGDYMDDKLSNSEVMLSVMEMGSDYMYVKDFLDPATRKKSEDGSKAWAIHYEEHDYVNLKYSNNAMAPNLCVRIDIKGRFCLAVMDPEFMESLDKAEHYTGGAINIYNPESRITTDAKYLNQAGELKRIFIIDTKDLSIVIPYKAKNAPAEFLTKSTLKWLVGKDNYKGSKSEYIVEEIVLIVEDLNRRQ